MIGTGRYKSNSLLCIMNDSFTKLYNEPESSKVQKGLRGFLVEEEVRERQNEFREREVVLRQSNGMLLLSGVGRITVHYENHLGSPVWRLRVGLDNCIIFNILFNMQNPSKIPLKLKLGISKVLQITL